MVSGVGFKSEASEEQKGVPRKRMVSRGLVVAFIVLVLTGALLGGLKMWESNLNNEIKSLESQVIDTKKEMNDKLSDSDVLDFSQRAGYVEKELYRGHSTNEVLDEIESIMVLNQDTGNRVVLKSFEHNAGAYERKSVGDVSAVITGPGSITISADADNFDVMAQQIEKFKESEYFDNVAVGTTDRDDFGRVVFTLTMDVREFDQSPYETYDGTGAMSEPAPASDENIFVEDGNVSVEANDGNVSVETNDSDVLVQDGNVDVDVTN